VVGPFSLSVNDESGLLIDGFDTPPYLMMGHARPYYAQHLEACGYRKAVDLIAYLFDMASEPPAAVTKTIERLRRQSDVRIRPFDMGRYRQEVETIAEIFNDAWADNWSFVPLSPPDIAFLAKNLRPLVSPGHAAIAELDGEAVAMAVTLPNVNEAIADLGGRLLPFGWAKLLWRLKVQGTQTARLPLMGVRRRFQNGPLGAALALGVIDAVRRYHASQGTKWGELSWVLEDNTRVRRIIEMSGASPYKTYRMYEKGLI
jgi:GNAT superfamily N-acetyltransferase